MKKPSLSHLSFSKNQLWFIPVAAVAFLIGFFIHRPPTQIVHDIRVQTKTTTTQKAPPVYHIGDTQDGITLVGQYHSSYQDMMGGGNSSTPPTVNVVAFAVSGVAENDLNENSAILTSKGIDSSHPAMTTISQCGSNSCAVFYDTGTPTIFYYKNLSWQL